MLTYSQFSSLALISGRATINALDTLTILMSSYLYVLCQGKPIIRSHLSAFPSPRPLNNPSNRYPRARPLFHQPLSILCFNERRLLTLIAALFFSARPPRFASRILCWDYENPPRGARGPLRFPAHLREVVQDHRDHARRINYHGLC